VHDDEHVVWINAEFAEQTFNVLFASYTVFEFKEVFTISAQDTGEEELVFVIF